MKAPIGLPRHARILSRAALLTFLRERLGYTGRVTLPRGLSDVGLYATVDGAQVYQVQPLITGGFVVCRQEPEAREAPAATGGAGTPAAGAGGRAPGEPGGTP